MNPKNKVNDKSLWVYEPEVPTQLIGRPDAEARDAILQRDRQKVSQAFAIFHTVTEFVAIPFGVPRQGTSLFANPAPVILAKLYCEAM